MAVHEKGPTMMSTKDLLVHPPAMAEVVGALLDTEHVSDAEAAVIATDLAAETEE